MKMGKIILVIFLKPSDEQEFKVEKIHIISEHNQSEHFDKVCDRNTTIFDKLIIRKKRPEFPFKIFERIEKNEFILELESYDDNRRKFLLHRFGLMFYIDQEHGLLLENLKNYKVSTTPYSHPYLPWNEKDNVSCLVLEKYVHNEMTQNLHSFKVIIPKELVDNDTQIKFPK